MNRLIFPKRLILIGLIHISSLALAKVHVYDSKKQQQLQKGSVQRTEPQPAKPQFRGKTVLCDDAKVQLVKVTFGRLTILNFPAPPKDILPGEVVFDFKKVRNELAIKALRPGARTNIAIYLQDRRCSFELMTVSAGGDGVLFVRDPTEGQTEVKYHE